MIDIWNVSAVTISIGSTNSQEKAFARSMWTIN